jgi:hypothetical protein
VISQSEELEDRRAPVPIKYLSGSAGKKLLSIIMPMQKITVYASVVQLFLSSDQQYISGWT